MMAPMSDGDTAFNQAFSNTDKIQEMDKRLNNISRLVTLMGEAFNLWEKECSCLDTKTPTKRRCV